MHKIWKYILLSIPFLIFSATVIFSLSIGPCSEYDEFRTEACNKFGAMINYDPHWAIFKTIIFSAGFCVLAVPAIVGCLIWDYYDYKLSGNTNSSDA